MRTEADITKTYEDEVRRLATDMNVEGLTSGMALPDKLFIRAAGMAHIALLVLERDFEADLKRQMKLTKTAAELIKSWKAKLDKEAADDII